MDTASNNDITRCQRIMKKTTNNEHISGEEGREGGKKELKSVSLNARREATI